MTLLKPFISFLFIALSIHLYAGENDSNPLCFIGNDGQWKKNVLFQADMLNGAVFLENNTFTYIQKHQKDLNEYHHLMHEENDALSDFTVRAHAWKMNFIEANEQVEIIGSEKRSEYYNFFLGNDRSKWAGGVLAYNTVIYKNLYAGVDMKVYSQNSNFKYDFIVSPNSNPSSISWEYEGLEKIKIKNGSLILTTSVGEFKELTPYAYQIINGSTKKVECEYVMNGTKIRFIFPKGYDSSEPLIIDPVLVAATFSGGLSTNYGHCATYDNSGNIYTGAISFGSNYPTTTGAFQTTFGGGGTDIAISKISPDASALIYATYIGGTGSDYPHSMIVNDNDELYVFGTSTSNNYPTSTTAYDNTIGAANFFENDIVVTHFTNDATAIIGSTFVGGDDNDGQNNLTSNYGDTYRGEIILDNTGNCYITSSTSSTDFPTTAGAYQTTYGGGTQDAVAFSLTPDLSTMLWSTYIGGTGHEVGFGLRLGNNGVYVCGATDNGFMTATGYQTSYQGGSRDGYALKLNSTGSTVTESTYWGTGDSDATFFLDIDNDGDVYIYGLSNGGTSPVSAGVYSNANSSQYIAKLDPSLSSVLFSTVLGAGVAGFPDFIPIAFMVDQCEFIYFSGHSASGSLPTTVGAFQTSGGFYLGVLEPDAVGLNFATHYGGSGDHVDGGTSRFDPNGIVYQGVCTGGGFTTTPGVFAPVSIASGWDVAVFKIDFQVNPLEAIANVSPSSFGCAPFTASFTNTSTATSYEWNFDDGSPINTSFQPTHTFVNPGIYNVMLVAFDSTACVTADTVYLTITVGSTLPVTASFNSIVDCATMTVDAQNAGTSNVIYEWNMGDGTIYTDSIVSHTYTLPGTYNITFIAGDTICGNTDTSTAIIVIPPIVIADISVSPDTSGCEPFTVTFNNNSNGVLYSWNFDDGSPIDNSFQPTHTFIDSGTYNVMLIAIDSSACNIVDTAEITITVLPIPIVDLGIDTTICTGTITLDAQNTGAIFTWQDGSANQTLIASTSGIYWVEVDDNGCTTRDSIYLNLNGPDLDFGPDIITCTPSFLLDALNPGADYLWQDGSTNQTFSVTNFGAYWVNVTIAGCSVSDTVVISQGSISVTLPNDTILCNGTSILLDAQNSGANYLWSQGDTNQSISIDTSGTYSVEVTEGFCYASDTVTIGFYSPNPLFSYTDTIGCQPLVTYFTNLSTTSIGVITSWYWTFGDGFSSNLENPSHEYINSGTYDVTLIVTTATGCSFSLMKQIQVTVYPKPMAAFTFSPNPPSTGELIQFTDQSIDALSWEWSFGSGDSSTLQSPTHAYEDIANFEVQLIVTNEECVDSIARTIVIKEELIYYVPNAFTPDGDEFNNTFSPVFTSGFDRFDYHLSIYNRWGEILFESHNFELGWDGTYNGKLVQDGVYTWKIEFANINSDERHIVHGHVNILR